MATEPRPQGEPPAAAVSSRDRILQAAKHLFATRGYENTSTVAIARMAGTSESQLMKHFGSKEGVLEAIFDHGWQAMSAGLPAVQQLPTPMQKMRALIDIVLAGLEHDEELRELLLLEGRRIRKEGNMVLLTSGFMQFVSMIDSILVEMRSSGQLDPDLNLHAIRSALIGIFEGLLRDQLLARRVGYPANYSGEELRRIFDVVLPSLAGGRAKRE
jgi:AcrR family transcriptional regulator